MGPRGKARISDCNFLSYLDMLSTQLGFRSSSRCSAWDVALAKSRRIGGGHDLLDHASRAHPRAEAVTSGRGSKAELVKTFVRANISDSFTFAEVKRAAPGVSDEYIRQVLRELRDNGIIEGTGAGRGAGWHRLRSDL